MPIVIWSLSLALGAATFRPGVHYGFGSQLIVGITSAVMALVGGWLLIPALILTGHCLGWKAANLATFAHLKYQERQRASILSQISVQNSKISPTSLPNDLEQYVTKL